MPKISIIIPVYNVEKYLTKCLKSVTKQTLKDIEIICINDGSTDKSSEILHSFAQKDNRIIVFDNENQGQSAARNFGITKATGEYIGFVDSDDWIDKDYYEKLYLAAKKYNADIACTGYRRCIYGNGSKRKVFYKEITANDINDKISLDNIPKDCYIWNKIYRRESWLEANLEFPKDKVYEDIAIILKIMNSLGTMVSVPNTYYHYRRRKNSTITFGNKKSKQDFLTACEEMNKYAKENHINVSLVNDSCSKRFIKICGIPIAKIKYYQERTSCLLFGFIPIATIKKTK